MTPEKLESFRVMAEVCLRDAQYEGLSAPRRADAAFDAVYMYCRCILKGADEGREHPQASVLLEAAAALKWPVEDIAVALERLDERLEPLRDGARYPELIALALRLKAAYA